MLKNFIHSTTMTVGWVAVTICLFLSMAIDSAELYMNKKLVRIYPKSSEDFHEVMALSHRHKRHLNFWDSYYADYLHVENYIPSEVDIMSSPRLYGLLLDTLKHRGIDHETVTANLQDDLDHYMEENFAALAKSYFDAFRPYQEMIAFMEEAVRRCKGRCSLFHIGHSYENRPLIGIKIGGLLAGDEQKNKIWIEAGHHAREWISHTSALYLADKLIEEYDDNPYVKQLVDKYEFYILPNGNPDGYNYTWTKDRMWRKSRSINPRSKCVGVDINRNFDFKWEEYIGSSSNPCKNNYRGPEPFSEPEGRAIRDFIMSETNRDSWLVYLSLHSRSQLILSAWGYTLEQPGDIEELTRVGTAMATAMSETHNMNYTHGQASRVLYVSSGTSRDWARAVARVKYTYTVELRDKDSRHWLLRPIEVIPVGQEVWNGLLSLMRSVDSRSPGEEYNMEEFLTTTTISPSQQKALLRKYTSRNGRSPISW